MTTPATKNSAGLSAAPVDHHGKAKPTEHKEAPMTEEVARGVDLKRVEQIVREKFYPGPIAGSTMRLSAGLAEYLTELSALSAAPAPLGGGRECPDCGGIGAHEPHPRVPGGTWMPCLVCDGTGKLAALSPPSGEEEGLREALAITDDVVVRYVSRFGGMCRDCADEDGTCPRNALPCDVASSDKAIRSVLEAVGYGVKHGYLPALDALRSPAGGIS